MPNFECSLRDYIELTRAINAERGKDKDTPRGPEILGAVITYHENHYAKRFAQWKFRYNLLLTFLIVTLMGFCAVLYGDSPLSTDGYLIWMSTMGIEVVAILADIQNRPESPYAQSTTQCTDPSDRGSQEVWRRLRAVAVSYLRS